VEQEPGVHEPWAGAGRDARERRERPLAAPLLGRERDRAHPERGEDPALRPSQRRQAEKKPGEEPSPSLDRGPFYGPQREPDQEDGERRLHAGDRPPRG